MNNLYPEPRALDLREELYSILYGGYDSSGVGQQVIVRKLTNEYCVCFNKLTGSPKDDCKFCQGEGYYFREELKVCYISRNFGSVLGSSSVISQQNQVTKEGEADSQKALAFFEFNAFPDYEKYIKVSEKTCDKIYQLKVDNNGKVVFPYIRIAKWEMRSVTPHQGDNSRIEYFEVGLNKANL